MCCCMQHLKLVVVPYEFFFLEILEKFVVTELKLDDLNMLGFWKGEAHRYFLKVSVFLGSRFSTAGIVAVVPLLGLQIFWTWCHLLDVRGQ